MNQVVIERDGAIVVFRLHRPPVNAVDLEFAREIDAAFAPLADATDVRAIVITGTGSSFSAGLDLKRVPLYGPEEQRAMITTLDRMLAKLYGCPLPVVGAVNGHAVAGGLILALACDYRVGSAAACKLGLSEVRAGIPFPAAAMAVLQAEVTPHAARVLGLRGNTIGPEAGLAYGLLDELQPPERVLPVAIEVARELAAMPHEAYARIKRQLRGKTATFIDETIALGSDPMLASWVTAEAPGAAADLLRRGSQKYDP